MSTMVTMRLVLVVVFGLIAANSLHIVWGPQKALPVELRLVHLLGALVNAGIAAWHLAKFIGWLAI